MKHLCLYKIIYDNALLRQRETIVGRVHLSKQLPALLFVKGRILYLDAVVSAEPLLEELDEDGYI